jgi:protoporphyrinogen oxidase
MMKNRETIVLGAGVTGLAAGIASGAPVFEASDGPGGICASYYMRPGDSTRYDCASPDGESFRFEIGGGHWIFGGDPAVLSFIESMARCKPHVRKASVFFPDSGLTVPYPLQNNLRFLDHGVASRALSEMALPRKIIRSMKDWLAESFGPTLCDLFFYPFHQLYTAGLHDRIAPQDVYKSPVDLARAIQGAFALVQPVGYNAEFLYPCEGLDSLTRKLAERCEVRYAKRAVAVDRHSREVHFSDGSSAGYERLISTLPLDTVMKSADLSADVLPDPCTSVLVLNIGAERGERCPDDHWLYLPNSRSGFFRVGFYSNVDESFLPAPGCDYRVKLVSIYVERAFLSGAAPGAEELSKYADSVVDELQDLGFIGNAHVVDSTWIDAAYTWSWIDSGWRTAALRKLEEAFIYQVGRYGRWVFQGIADSVRDGLMVGAAMKSMG